MKTSSFSSKEKGREALHAALAEGRPVGMQTSVFYLTYFPPAYRFHFNGHNLIAYGKEGDEYLIRIRLPSSRSRIKFPAMGIIIKNNPNKAQAGTLCCTELV